MAIRLTSLEDFKIVVDRFDVFLFDCDGVLWTGDAAIDGVPEVIDMLRAKGKTVIYITNISAKSRRTIKRKFDLLNIKADMDEIFSAGYAAAVYISSILKFSPTDKVYLIGTSGNEEELAGQGISWIGGTSAEDKVLGDFDLSTFKQDANVRAVLCAGDGAITYTKLAKAFQYLRGDHPCEFLCVNLDLMVPVKGGVSLGAGALTFAVSTALGREPLLIGKPERILWECILARYPIDPSRAVIVGDTLHSDIGFGKNVGISTILALTGATKEKALQAALPSERPDYVINSLGDFRVLVSGVDESP